MKLRNGLLRIRANSSRMKTVQFSFLSRPYVRFTRFEFFSLFSILTLSCLDATPFSSSLSFFPFELLAGSPGDAGNVSFVREPVPVSSSNHLFPSSLGYI
ncbi:hypothetical protein PUN28_007044 [Cardiocondyla obscurior]|uniref:Uncharacterized protein n=1 Tax=Cardiocondyla obscurior TaxID=286306 RepID=A0AAW2G719_9HYME